MLKRFTQLGKRFLGLSSDMKAPAVIEAEFLLKYKDITVGTLRLHDGKWFFTYSDEFRHQDELRPIVEFPDVYKPYRSESLWPFFQMRIPSPKQSSVQRVISDEQIQHDDEVKLLSRFGRLTIANPYELIPTRLTT